MSRKKNRSLKKQNAALKRKVEEYSMDSASTYLSPSGGWNNFNNNFGQETDPTFNTTWMPPYEFTFNELRNLYQNPLIYRVITLHSGDGTRKGFELVSKENSDLGRDIQQQMDEEYNWLALGAKMIAIRHAYGGGMLYVDAEDGRDDEEPLNENRVNKILSFQPIECFYAQPVTSRPMRGEEKPGQPLHYKITLQGFGAAESFTCHESRLIRFPSWESDDVISQSERQRRRTWPFSTTQLIYDAIKRYGIGMQSESQLLQSFVDEVFKVSNLKGMKDLTGFRDFVREQQLMKNSLKARIVGADDDIIKTATPTQGIGDITKDQRRDTGMVTGIPVPILFSEESGDLGGSTLSESRKVWFDNVETRQTNQYTPMFNRMMWFKSLETGWDIDDIMIHWNPLQSMTPFEQAELENKVAETDKIYVESLGANEAEILDRRWGGGKFSAETPDFDKAKFEKELEEMEEAEAEEAKMQFEALQSNNNQPAPKKEIPKESKDERETQNITILNVPPKGISDESLDSLKEDIKNIPQPDIKGVVEEGLFSLRDELLAAKQQDQEKKSFTLEFDE